MRHTLQLALCLLLAMAPLSSAQNMDDVQRRMIFAEPIVVKWKQEIMPVTDVSILSLILSNAQAKKMAEAHIDNVAYAHLRAEVVNGSITPHGVSMLLNFTVGTDSKVDFETSEKLRKEVVDEWKKRLRRSYQKAADHVRMEHERQLALATERFEVAKHHHDKLRKLLHERAKQIQTADHQSVKLEALRQQQLDARMQLKMLHAQRASIEEQLKQVNEQAEAANDRHAERIAELELQLERRNADANAAIANKSKSAQEIAKQLQSELALVEAQIQLERSKPGFEKRQVMMDRLQDTALEERQMQMMMINIENELKAIEDQKVDVDSPDLTSLEIDVEMAEIGMRRLGERLVELRNSDDGSVSEMVFIRLAE